MAVVVLDELVENVLQVPAVGDQHPVQALPPDRANESLGDRIRLRRPDWRVEHTDPLGIEYRVETRS
jgi:hypothetical protein